MDIIECHHAKDISKKCNFEISGYGYGYGYRSWDNDLEENVSIVPKDEEDAINKTLEK